MEPNTTQEPVKQEVIAATTDAAVAPAPAEETVEQINWKKFRESREAERIAKLEAEKIAKQKAEEAAALKAALDALLNKPDKQQQTNSWDQSDESEEERLKKVVESMLKMEREKERLEQQEREAAEFPTKLRQNFNDFDKVVTAESLDYLEFHHPEISEPLKNMPDGYDKWRLAYQTLKKMVPNQSHEKDKARIEQNLSKPQSPSSGLAKTGDSAPAYLDDATKAANWARMQKIRKGI